MVLMLGLIRIVLLFAFPCDVAADDDEECGGLLLLALICWRLCCLCSCCYRRESFAGVVCDASVEPKEEHGTAEDVMVSVRGLTPAPPEARPRELVCSALSRVGSIIVCLVSFVCV